MFRFLKMGYVSNCDYPSSCPSPEGEGTRGLGLEKWVLAAGKVCGSEVLGDVAVFQVAQVGYQFCFAAGQAVCVDQAVGDHAFGVEFCGSAEF